ncbi:hypothetical protein HUU62_18525 [Rhodoferax sp. 4810]|nr:hypothetical protein [Rhodoferax jenense]
MAIEFLLVTFPEQRAVLADGAGVGFTNHILMLPGDEYEITLEGNTCAPASQVIALSGTAMVKPMVIAFDLLAPAALARSGAPAPMVSDVKPAKPAAAKKARAPVKSAATPRKKTGKKTSKKPAPQASKPKAAKAATKVKKNA